MPLLRCYRELKRLPTFEERYEYLRLAGLVGEATFGFDRYLNQMLYTSGKWKQLRNDIIIRDNGCDLGVEGYNILGYQDKPKGENDRIDRIIVHHMNPLTEDEVKEVSDSIFNPEYLICVSLRTHNAIHFGDKSLLPQAPIERRPGDTCPWK